MRIALTCLDPGVPLGGTKGCSVHLRAVAGALLRAGHRVTALVAREGAREDTAALVEAGLRVHAIDTVHHTESLAQGLAEAAPDLVVERLALHAPDGAITAARLGLAHFYEANAPLDREAAEHRGLADTGAARVAFRRGFAHTRGVVAVSDEVADWVRALAPPELPLLVAANGADPMFFAPPDPEPLRRARAALAPVAGSFRIGFAGSFRPWHDVGTMVRAIAMLCPSAAPCLVLIGDGPGLDGTRALARELAVPVVGVGRVAHDEMPVWLAQCDAVVVPYARPEDWFSPIKLIEAMACGRAVVASATRPCARIVTHGFDGLLVEPGDPGALAEALGRLARDPALRERLGTEARATALAHHSWDAVVERVLQFAAPLAAGCWSR
jgi:glycosyltransferase involved in cell wall biosynthesis